MQNNGLQRICKLANPTFQEAVQWQIFGHLTVDKLLRKALRGDLALPIVRIENSKKAQRGVHLVDLATYIDKRREAALKECRQLSGTT